MLTITERQTKTIAKEVVLLSKENKTIKHSKVLEVISKALGYRDYNGLNAAFESDNNLDLVQYAPAKDNDPFNMDSILKEIRKLVQALKGDLSKKEIKILELELKQQRNNYERASVKEQRAKEASIQDILKTKSHEEKECPNCKGKGGWEVSVSTTVDDMMWYDDGEFFTLVQKECFWCSGAGRITNRRLKEVKKIKREDSKPQ